MYPATPSAIAQDAVIKITPGKSRHNRPYASLSRPFFGLFASNSATPAISPTVQLARIPTTAAAQCSRAASGGVAGPS